MEEFLTPSFMLQLVVSIGAAVGVYAGIKADLAVSRSVADAAHKAADLAHRRIDDLLARTRKEN